MSSVNVHYAYLLITLFQIYDFRTTSWDILLNSSTFVLDITVHNFLVNFFSNHGVFNTNLTIPFHFCEKDEESLNVARA
jgi:hypothetical protein